MNIWQFQDKLTRRLLTWASVSLFAGFGMSLDNFAPIRAMGQQFMGWGAINALIALFGRRSMRRRKASLADPFDEEVVQKEARKIRRILLINAVLDVGYLWGGSEVAKLTGDDEESEWRGHAWGIFVQATFLLLFDIFQAIRIPRNQKRGR